MCNLQSLKKHKFIVLCEDHYNPLTLIRSLGQDGIKPIIFMIGKEYRLIPFSKYAKKINYIDSINDGLNRIVNLYGGEKEKPFLFSCSDNVESELDKRYDELKDKFYFFNGGGAGVISSFMDKETISIAAYECGLDIPRSEVVKNGSFPSKVSYPIMTKSVNSLADGWKKNVFICFNQEDLEEAYRRINSDEVLLEEYIDKKNELCLDGVSLDGGNIVYMPFKCNYLRFTNKAYGNFMEISPFHDIALTNKITKLFRKTKFTGIFSIEFLITKDNKLKFLEINFRHSTWAISSKIGGANLPLLWAQSMLGEKIDFLKIPLKQEPFTAMAELQDFNDHVKDGDLSIKQWMKEFHNCKCTYIYDKDDRRPFFMVFGQAAISFIKKRIPLYNKK